MIFALSGKKRSGKSTAATYLAEHLNATRINFKDALISEVTTKFPDLLSTICMWMDKTDYDGWGSCYTFAKI